MKLLSKKELLKAEEVLRNCFPQSLKAYGYVFMINRIKADPIDILVDHWPDFNVLFVRPRQTENADIYKDISIFAKDGPSLSNLLTNTAILDWKQYFCLSYDLCYMALLNDIGVNEGVTNIQNFESNLLTLQDVSKLPTERFPLQVSSLNESHLDLVNSTWKFATGEFSKRFIRDMILNFPSCCVLDSDGQPVSWILTYASCAVGMLYTLPEHRRKGYAKALVTILAKKLHSEGYPVYCLIDVGNQPSYRLFTSLGFVNDPSYVTAWLICDPDFNKP